jgi:deoxyribonuclease V
LKSIHWPENIAQAKIIQEHLRAKVKIVRLKKKPRFIAGVDAAFSEKHVFAAACLFSYPDLEFIAETTAVAKITFPYVPGYLSFREGPAIIYAVERMRTKPDLILVDGQGIAHPRGIGIASHIGVLLDIPTIGCAKSRLIGRFSEPGLKKGHWSPLLHEGKIIGAVLRTRDGIRPLFVSPGHRVSFVDSIDIVLACTRHYRISEPLRRADFLSKKARRERSAG